jgi:hypothetical protein
VAKGPTGSCERLLGSITVAADTTQLIVALVLVGLLLGMLTLGGYLLYKNREGAIKFLLSFLSYEVSLTADILLEAWDFAGCLRACVLACACACCMRVSVRVRVSARCAYGESV